MKAIDLESKSCPKCSKPLILRKGKYGDFYGCSGFPKCRTIVEITSNEKKVLRKIKNPSDYQAAIFDWVLNGTGNVVIKATAGSGKTTVQEHVVALLIEMGVPTEEIIYAVYNSHVAREGVEKGLPSKTTHQIGLGIITSYTGKRVKVDDDKISNIVKNLIRKTWDESKWMISPVGQIVSKLKNTLAPWDNQTQDKICAKFGIEVNGSADQIFELVRQAMEESNKQLEVIDFDDMIYLPVKHKMPIKQYKWVLLDEAQDTNRAQIELILKMIGGRVLVVGDGNQSMYSFRGAAPDAMDRLTEALNATELPLSISYRNPTSHVDLINKIFPDIKHEKSPYAKVGDILTMSQDKMLGELKDGDRVICRTNAPLVEPVFALIRQGVKAVIRGRDIGKNLVALIERFDCKTTEQLIDKLVEYRRYEVAKLMRQDKASQAESLDDKVNTILALADGCEVPYQIVQKVSEVFSDKKEGIIFSSIHRAKGDEGDNIYILNPQLMPHPMAVSQEDQSQERNILFVALSRSKDKLIFVGGPVPEAFESTGMWEEDDELTEEIIKGAQTLLESFDTSTAEGKAEYIKFLQTDGNR